MHQIGQSQSLLIDDEQNEFLSDRLDYENCPFCARSFFRGKLAFHLKHCSSEHPMTRKDKKSPRHIKNSLSAANHYERCIHCNSRMPSFLVAKHREMCQEGIILKHRVQMQIKENEPEQEQSLLPRIRQSALKEHSQTSKKITKKSMEPIRIREDLRCFKIAEGVQKVSCQFCQRKFSQKAAERHIPICRILTENERKKAAFSKDSKSMVLRKDKTKLLALGRSYETTSPSKLLTKMMIKVAAAAKATSPQAPTIQNPESAVIQSPLPLQQQK